MFIFELQPTLSDGLVLLQPLQTADFERLYALASDPLIWEQHPEPDRYRRSVFEGYFAGAMASGGAFLVLDAATQQPIGSTRFYDFDAQMGYIYIGYTFLARAYWGGKYNRAVKKLLLTHAFQYVDTVRFSVGQHNIRSQTAMQRIGGTLVQAATNNDPNVYFVLLRSSEKAL